MLCTALLFSLSLLLLLLFSLHICIRSFGSFNGLLFFVHLFDRVGFLLAFFSIFIGDFCFLLSIRFNVKIRSNMCVILRSCSHSMLLNEAHFFDVFVATGVDDGVVVVISGSKLKSSIYFHWASNWSIRT